MTRNYVAGIVNSFGFFLDLDERTKACSLMKYARACVEIDVSQPIPDEVQITLSDGKKFWQQIEVVGNVSYCSYCKFHGHDLAACRKKKPINNGVDMGTKGVMNPNLHGSKQKEDVSKTAYMEVYPEKNPSKNGVPEKKHVSKHNASIQVTIQDNARPEAPATKPDHQEWIKVSRKKKGREVKFQFAEPSKRSNMVDANSNFKDNQNPITDEENNDNVDKMALVIFQKSATENLVRNNIVEITDDGPNAAPAITRAEISKDVFSGVSGAFGCIGGCQMPPKRLT
ncbi:hypothetical protein QQ045_016910 [Rhodiola kirilowii]